MENSLFEKTFSEMFEEDLELKDLIEKSKLSEEEILEIFKNEAINLGKKPLMFYSKITDAPKYKQKWTEKWLETLCLNVKMKLKEIINRNE